MFWNTASCPPLPTSGKRWELVNQYAAMVVVATPVVRSVDLPPVVTRIRQATGGAFQIKLQNPSGQPVPEYPVNYVVVEQGVYTPEQHGIRLEAARSVVHQPSRSGAWLFAERELNNSYDAPVVVGQVLTANDDRWSVFWSSSAHSRGTRTIPGSFSIGYHMGNDPDSQRSAETVGYIVTESGHASLGRFGIAAAVTRDKVRGLENHAAGYPYTGFEAGDILVASASLAAMGRQ